ncbi:MAG: lysophospholipid acyltransferase family protein [Paludibacter sp.]|nr:lysophospholipid acyltransferase family protein [Paludibacter sp.]
MFYIFYAVIWTVSWLPMKALYVLSDLIFPVIYHVAGYRKKVVRRNLINSFPEKSLKEIIRIEKKFYHYFCDLMLETIRQLHAPKSEMKKRMAFENLELLTAQAEQGKSVMLMTAHYCNWEWTSVICLHLPSDFKAYPVYQELKDKHFDKLMFQLRNRYGAVNIEKRDLIRTMLNMRNDSEHGVFGMISDQSPMARNIRFRMDFLHQDTPVFLGTEQLAKKYDYPVFYLDIQRVKRGYYKAVVEPLTLTPTETAEYEITKAFMQRLEKDIQQRPEFWLWSHNRWKHSKTTTA